MTDSYITISSPGEAIYKEKGSKFLAFAFPVCTAEEVKEHLEQLRKEYFDALVAEGVPGFTDYWFARPANGPWFRNRRQSHPWNNPLCQGDPCREFPCPNADKAMDDYFILFIYESWGEEEAEQLLTAFRKLDAAFGVKR